MKSHRVTLSAKQVGFTLIELMVGVALGLLTVAIITQVVVLSEGQKRTTTNGADAQVNGALALYAIQQEAQMAGYGVSANPTSLGCDVRYQSAAGAGSFTLAPVLIGPGTNGSDTITFLRSSKSSFSVPIRVTENHPQANSNFLVQSAVGVDLGDLMVAVPPTYDPSNWCTIVQVNQDATNTLTNTTVPHVADAAGWNPAAAILPATGYPASSYLINLGDLALRKFAIDSASQSLQKSELSKATGTWTVAQSVQPQIVVLKAMYGKDTNGDGVVDTYDQATPTTNAGWTQVLSVRLLVVARSAQFERGVVASPNVDAAAKSVKWDVGSTAVTITGATACNTNSQCLSISLAYLGADWDHYRYKVYDTVVPLRNVLWNS
ncbi:MAG: PilW family protein [Burkholderiales bacterium]|nr:PilW family protein [Burkholderiales bacterium]